MPRDGRIPLSKRKRFSIFKRDDFTCRYCGRKPPTAVLEVDHIIAVAEGGSDEEHNLLTSCFDCNRGKGAESLSVIPIDLEARTRLLAEQIEQVRAYESLLRRKKRRIGAATQRIAAIYEIGDHGWTIGPSGRASIRRFLELLPETEVAEAMELACAKFSVSSQSLFRYFCGICWRKVREVQDGPR